MNPPIRPQCRIAYFFRGKRGELAIEGERAIVGRSTQADLSFPDESLSRKHAEFVFADGAWSVRDLGSMNGVFVEGERVSDKKLTNGMRLAIGGVELRCRIDAEPASARVVFDDAQIGESLRSVVDMDELDRRRASPAVPGAAASRQDGAWIAEPLREAAEALLSARDLDDLLRRFLELVARHLSAERGFVGLCDGTGGENGEVVPRATWTRDTASAAPIVISRQIAKVAVDSHCAVLVGDAASDDRFTEAESIRQMKIRSAMCAPLLRDGHVGGLIYVDKQSEEQPFSEASLQVLSILATLAAVAVEETKLRDAFRREQQVRERLSRYSSRAVVEQIVNSHETGGEPGMRCEEREITVLFCDFAGFTSFAEKLTPAEVSRTLNSTFERLCAAVFAEAGTLDKFTGDGMMVFFGAPTAQPDHADRAVRAALRMRQALAEPAADGAAPLPLQMRVGINSGKAIVGDVGSLERRDYTVLGDTVNLASRLESGVAKPGQIVIGPTTHALLQERFLCEPLEPRPLKGISRTVQPWLVIEPARSES